MDITPPPPPSSPLSARTPHAHPGLYAVIAILVIIIAAGVVWVFWPETNNTGEPMPSSSVTASPMATANNSPSPSTSPERIVPMGMTNFSSQYFTLTFKVPEGFEVRDAQDSIRIAQIPYTTREIGDDNAFFVLKRYAPGDTKEARKAAYLGIFPERYTESSILIDGFSFPMLSGQDVGRFEGDSAGKVIAIFLDKSFIEVIQRPANSDVNFDPIAVAKDILATMMFTK